MDSWQVVKNLAVRRQSLKQGVWLLAQLLFWLHRHQAYWLWAQILSIVSQIDHLRYHLVALSLFKIFHLQPKFGGKIIDIVSGDLHTPEQKSRAVDAVKNTILDIFLIVIVGYYSLPFGFIVHFQDCIKLLFFMPIIEFCSF